MLQLRLHFRQKNEMEQKIIEILLLYGNRTVDYSNNWVFVSARFYENGYYFLPPSLPISKRPPVPELCLAIHGIIYRAMGIPEDKRTPKNNKRCFT